MVPLLTESQQASAILHTFFEKLHTPPHFFYANCLHSALFVCTALIFKRFKRVDKLSNHLHYIYTVSARICTCLHLSALICTSLHFYTQLHLSALICTHLHFYMKRHLSALIYTYLHTSYTTITTRLPSKATCQGIQRHRESGILFGATEKLLSRSPFTAPPSQESTPVTNH